MHLWWFIDANVKCILWVDGEDDASPVVAASADADTDDEVDAVSVSWNSIDVVQLLDESPIRSLPLGIAPGFPAAAAVAVGIVVSSIMAITELTFQQIMTRLNSLCFSDLTALGWLIDWFVVIMFVLWIYYIPFVILYNCLFSDLVWYYWWYCFK